MLPAPVLVVEDDASIRNLFCVALRVHGLGCHQAKDGDEALRLLAEHRYAVMLLDLMMPGTSGYGVVEAIAAGKVARPTAVFLASAAEFDRDRIPGDIVHLFLRKPFDVMLAAELVGHVVAALEPALPSPVARGVIREVGG